jgi:hypothetical protein
MDNLNKRCEACGEVLRPSQYARTKKEGEPALKDNENLVCRNPNCPKAEKEIN